jgi:hypothetical protein
MSIPVTEAAVVGAAGTAGVHACGVGKAGLVVRADGLAAVTTMSFRGVRRRAPALVVVLIRKNGIARYPCRNNNDRQEEQAACHTGIGAKPGFFAGERSLL